MLDDAGGLTVQGWVGENCMIGLKRVWERNKKVGKQKV